MLHLEGEVLVTTNKTLSTIREYLRAHWKMLAAGVLVGFVLVAITFTLPLINIAREIIQTEHSVDMQQESYVVNEPYTITEFIEGSKVVASGFYKVVPSGVIILFVIGETDSVLVGQFDNTIPGSFTVLTDTNRIVWETRGSRGMINLPLPPGRYLAKFREDVMWGEDCFLYLAIKWKYTEQVTRYQQVINYRDVPVKVERQSTIITEERISVWKYLFRANDI